MSALLSSTASMGLRRSVPGCSAGCADSCARTSGLALSSTQRTPSALTATEDWVRGGTAGSPARAASHWGQPQFH